MDELVKRLRELASIPEHCENVANCDECTKEEICLSFTNKRIIEVATKAADAIEELSERIATYEKAEAEGRMIILPVKEGTPLYVDGKIFAAHCKGEIHEVKGWYYSFPMIYKDFRGEHDYVIDPDSIGNSVFLTREEAEENLVKEKI